MQVYPNYIITVQEYREHGQYTQKYIEQLYFLKHAFIISIFRTKRDIDIRILLKKKGGLKFLKAIRQIFGLSNRWHTEINSSRNLACAHMACLQNPGSCQTDQLQDTAHNIPSSTEIFISANEECLLPDGVLDVDWKKACVDIHAASFMFYITSSFPHPNKKIFDSSRNIKKHDLAVCTRF